VIAEVGGRTPGQLRRSLHDAADDALARLPAIPFDRVIKRSGHLRIAFGEFVATRVVEMGVHTMDIAQATGRAEQVRPEAAAVIAGILDGLIGEPVAADREWDSTSYILTATGRRRLSPHERDQLGALASRYPLLR
jgi:hypothetical protein